MSRVVYGVLTVLIVWSSSDLNAQRRRPDVKPAEKSSSSPTSYLGVTANYNYLSGIEWEASLSGRKKKTSRSTFSILAGQSSRFGSFKLDEQTDKKTSFVNGIGAGVAIHNYLDRINRGVYWSVGVAGHYYFHSFVDQGINDADQITYTKYKNLKTFSIFGGAGYQWKTQTNQNLKAQVFLGVMGSPFKSSSPASINGFYYGAGIGYMFRLR